LTSNVKFKFHQVCTCSIKCINIELAFDIDDEDNPPFIEIGLGVNFAVPDSPIVADIKLFDVPPDVEVEDLIEITGVERWHWFMGNRIGPYIQQGEDIAGEWNGE